MKTMDINFDTDHRLLKGRLKGGVSRGKYKKYLKLRRTHKADIFGKKNTEQREVDKMMEKLHVAVGKSGKKRTERKSWISEAAFDIMHQKLKALRTNQPLAVKELGKQLRQQI